MIVWELILFLSALQIVEMQLKINNTIKKSNLSPHHSKMDIRDFENNFKYKLFLPILYVVNWALMLTGPFFYPALYQYVVLGVFTIIALKSAITFVWSIIALFDGVSLLYKYRQIQKKQLEKQSIQSEELQALASGQNIQSPNSKKAFFAFVIPSYREDLELLGDTLTHLAKHSEAKKRYLVFLAMEAHQEGSPQKAKVLIDKFSKYFKLMSFSHHVMREHEQKGKASNVSWCVQHLEENQFKKVNVDPNSVFITVIDADSWVPQIYMTEIDERIENNFDRSLKTIYQPAQMFTRNNFDVPMITRTYDISHSAIHFANLISFFNTSFPLSNYTLSYKLIKRIGFWDTCPDAIGEDFHTTIKAFWKTNGNVRTQYVHTPFNQVNVQTGNGYIEDVKARFWQAERHARGCADVAYTLKMFFEKPFNWKTFIIGYNVIECFVLPCLIPWVFAGNQLMNFTFMFIPRPDTMIDESYSARLLDVATYSLLTSYAIYYFYIRYCSQKFYGISAGPLWRFIEYPILLIPNIIFVSVPTFVIAAFKVMLNKNEYNTAMKVMKNRNTETQNIQQSQVLTV